MGTIAERAATAGRGLRQPRIRLFEREAPLGYVLLVPTMVILAIFLLYPFLFGLWLSLTDSEVGNVGKFVGLGNFSFLIRVDHVFRASFVNTFVYTAVTTVFKLLLGLVMALLLNQVFPLQRFVRAALLPLCRSARSSRSSSRAS